MSEWSGAVRECYCQVCTGKQGQSQAPSPHPHINTYTHAPSHTYRNHVPYTHARIHTHTHIAHTYHTGRGQIVRVDEDGMCAYAMIFETPVAYALKTKEL